MTVFSVLYKEIAWVLSPNKYGSIPISNGDYSSLIVSIPMSFATLSLRYILERYCFTPLGKSLGIKIKTTKLCQNSNLEELYKRVKQPNHSEISRLSNQLGIPEREIEAWFWQRRKLDKPSTIIKFCQSSWRFTYYTFAFCFGSIVLWDKPWLWDITECWRDFPNQIVTSDIWWYYMVSLAFYWSLFFGQFFIDVKRKDFWEMFIHHTAAILLISFSWLSGVYRIGTLVLLLHDCADLILELAKAAKYADYQTMCNSLFGIFTIVWIITRLGIYPFWIIHHTVFVASNYVSNFGAYYTFNGLLILLLILHCFWTYLILKIVIESLKGKDVEDVRSSSEDDENV